MNTFFDDSDSGPWVADFLPRFPFWTLAALALLLPACLKAETPLSGADTEFLQKTAQGGMTEVELGKLAVEKAASESVRGFGKKMVDDHAKLNDRVKSFASKHKVKLTETLDGKHQEKVNELSKLSGKAFDDAYLEKMEKMHDKDVASFEAQLKSTQNPDLKEFIEDALPVLKKHQQHLEEIQKTKA